MAETKLSRIWKEEREKLSKSLYDGYTFLDTELSAINTVALQRALRRMRK